MQTTSKVIIALSVVAILGVVTTVYMFNEHNKILNRMVANETLRIQNQSGASLNFNSRADKMTPIGFRLQGSTESGRKQEERRSADHG